MGRTGLTLRLRRSTVALVREGELVVSRDGRSVVVRHGGLAPQAWTRLRGRLQDGLDIPDQRGAGEAPTRPVDEVVLLGCLQRAGALVPDQWWAGLPDCHPGVRDLLEVCCDEPRRALEALHNGCLGATGGQVAATAAWLLTAWGLPAAWHADGGDDPLHVVICWRPAHAPPPGFDAVWVVTASADDHVIVSVGTGRPVTPRPPAGRCDTATDARLRCVASIGALAAVRYVAATVAGRPAGQRPAGVPVPTD